MSEEIHELDTVVLCRDLPDSGLHAGDHGAVVVLYPDGSCEVEFVAESGYTVALLHLEAADVRPAHPTGRL